MNMRTKNFNLTDEQYRIVKSMQDDLILKIRSFELDNKVKPESDLKEIECTLIIETMKERHKV